MRLGDVLSGCSWAFALGVALGLWVRADFAFAEPVDFTGMSGAMAGIASDTMGSLGSFLASVSPVILVLTALAALSVTVGLWMRFLK